MAQKNTAELLLAVGDEANCRDLLRERERIMAKDEAAQIVQN